MKVWVECKQIPCAQLLVVHKGEEILHTCQGAGADGALQRDAIFRIYSMTKPVTACLALILVERGVLSLDDPVATYLPSFANQKVFVKGEDGKTEPLKRPLTVRHLLTHTSGITYGIFGASAADKTFCCQFPAKDKKEWFAKVPLPDLVEAVANTPLMFQPGEAWHYGWSLDVLGRLLEVACAKHSSGQANVEEEVSLGELMKRELFVPLGMPDTGFEVPKEEAHRLVPCAVTKPGFGFIRPTPPGLFAAERVAPTGNFESGGGGLVSTADDFMNFMGFLQTGCVPADHRNGEGGKGKGRRLLSDASVALLKANALPGGADVKDFSHEKGAFAEGMGPGFGFGLGAMSVLTDPSAASGGFLSGKGEFGWGGVASTWFFVDPEHDLAAVFMTQLVPSSSLPMRPHLRLLAHKAAGLSK
jgi:CubicO group peptidase (beta-lactamase class C family)